MTPLSVWRTSGRDASCGSGAGGESSPQARLSVMENMAKKIGRMVTYSLNNAWGTELDFPRHLPDQRLRRSVRSLLELMKRPRRFTAQAFLRGRRGARLASKTKEGLSQTQSVERSHDFPGHSATRRIASSTRERFTAGWRSGRDYRGYPLFDPNGERLDGSTTVRLLQR